MQPGKAPKQRTRKNFRNNPNMRKSHNVTHNSGQLNLFTEYSGLNLDYSQ